ncbi:MAG TPA: hypothetical protein VNF68_07895 [Candidatus Baltobacteraceae bacterium]|nr:hypothetical protein [Candidatus Baltobacteraceae bacterium]
MVEQLDGTKDTEALFDLGEIDQGKTAVTQAILEEVSQRALSTRVVDVREALAKALFKYLQWNGELETLPMDLQPIVAAICRDAERASASAYASAAQTEKLLAWRRSIKTQRRIDNPHKALQIALIDEELADRRANDKVARTHILAPYEPAERNHRPKTSTPCNSTSY